MLALMSLSSIPLSTVEFLKHCTKELLNDVLSYIKIIYNTVLVLKNNSFIDSPDVNELHSEFEALKDSFSGID